MTRIRVMLEGPAADAKSLADTITAHMGESGFKLVKEHTGTAAKEQSHHLTFEKQ